jgi:RNA polymerase sigma-70 factor (ECF subfamily)
MTVGAAILAAHAHESVRSDPATRGAPLAAAGETPSSEELARRAQAGCPESFTALVARHGAAVFNYLLQMTRHRQDAEDLTQETFLKVFRHLGRAEAPVAFRAWLLTIARRTAYNHFRAARPVEALDPDLESALPDPATATAASDDRDALWAAARKLRPRQFEALWLRYAEGLTVEEVAGVMRLHSIHVRVLLHRGRRHLRHRLKGGRHATGVCPPIPDSVTPRRVP